ncbi:MAG: bifunctional tRNA (5-methylaminomethyl-2-thiouridine)(34)-methyltransferase MnmD/FAD-dependent 5-carboxymethylaminomethyl-2-thiouridine(34) oxidoreductase MnmC [Campylobacter sp.]|nr:bifunctional tRNA (5-methylaminomethyl-2-thiouridine)(34)-methyltransferase MnmD/FAD-dependent 5-carboxymethylaminomethyl-2-thiouridine(34) oxidoreductase MnmC [Campylobacter sp.]
MNDAKLAFKGKTAFSQEFDDIYFNTEAPQKESQYVFASAIDEIWDKKDEFIVGELGFGVGLNFLTIAKKFHNSPKKLHFVSIENFMLSKAEFQEIYEKLGIYKRESKKLISNLPPRVSGIHRINFAENITLDLCFGEASQMIKELDFKADLWLLDGFAPAKNPQMWSEDLLKSVASLTKKGGILRTYSCAKMVRENLSKAGFCVELKQGYGKKRQMSEARLQNEVKFDTLAYFARPNANNKAKNVLIIGAGIAGLATGMELKKLGFNVTIAEKDATLGKNASSNHCGILIPLVTKPEVQLGRMHINAFLKARNFYENALNKGLITYSGAYEYAFDETLFARYFAHQGFSDEIFGFEPKAKPFARLFVKGGAYARPAKICKKFAKNFEIKFSHCYQSHKHLKNGKISVKFDGLRPLFCDILIFATGSQSKEIFSNLPLSFVRGQVSRVNFGQDLSNLINENSSNLSNLINENSSNSSNLISENSNNSSNLISKNSSNSSNLINKNSSNLSNLHCENLAQRSNLKSSSMKSQTSDMAFDLNTPHSAMGYITPFVDDSYTIGASYARNEKFDEVRIKDDIENIQKVKDFLQLLGQDSLDFSHEPRDDIFEKSGIKLLSSRVSYRSYSSDRFPIIGALHDENYYKKAYAKLFWTKHKAQQNPPRYEPNVFLNIAHGSRGLGTAILGAQLIGDLLTNRPLCIEKSLFYELHPARFLIRKLKKGKKA